MSKELISKIKEAEAEASRIKNSARDEAKARIQKAESDGKKLCDDTAKSVEKADGQKIKLTQQKADELLVSVREETNESAKKMQEAAEFNMREAVRFIISGVNEQCQ